MAKEKERFEILVEELKSDFKLAFDGISTLRNETQRGFEEVKEQIKFVDGKVEFLGTEVREIKKELKEVKGKVDKIDHTLEEHVRQPAHA